MLLKKCIGIGSDSTILLGLVEAIGIETEGIYRISGSSLTVEKLSALLKKNPTTVHFGFTPKDDESVIPKAHLSC